MNSNNNLQEEFAPCRGSSTGVVATEGSVESLPPSFHFGDLRRGRMGESTRQVEGLSPTLHFGDASQFESLLAEAFS